MTYETLMVHLELGRSNADLLQIAGDLAKRSHASVIGIAACEPMQIVYGDGFISGDNYERDRQELDKEMKAAEAEFRSALQTRAMRFEWRSTVMFTLLSDYFAREARSADLVITGIASGDMFDSSRSLNMGDVVMRAGRPVLVVPAAAGKVKLERVVVGWKDTRETWRAVSDACRSLSMPVIWPLSRSRSRRSWPQFARISRMSLAGSNGMASKRSVSRRLRPTTTQPRCTPSLRTKGPTSSWQVPTGTAACANGRSAK